MANAEEIQIKEALSALRAAALEASAVIVARLDRSRLDEDWSADP